MREEEGGWEGGRVDGWSQGHSHGGQTFRWALTLFCLPKSGASSQNFIDTLNPPINANVGPFPGPILSNGEEPKPRRDPQYPNPTLPLHGLGCGISVCIQCSCVLSPGKSTTDVQAVGIPPGQAIPASSNAGSSSS